MARLSESSSDGEEMRSLQASQAVPYELRSAKRTAATGLLVSAAACLCSLGLVIHQQTTSVPGVVAPVASGAVGLSEENPLQQVTAEVNGLLHEAHAIQFGIRPVPHHLVAPMSLRTEASASSALQRQMPAGVQVFPIGMKGGWTQVVVPQVEAADAAQQSEQQSATFGWLPLRTDDGATLLVEDKELKNRKFSASRGPPPSADAVRATWDEAKAKNKQLQEQVAELQRAMLTHRQPHFGAAVPEEEEEEQHASVTEQHTSVTERRSKGGAALKAEVSKVVNMAEVSKQVRDLHTNLAKELKKGKLLNSVGKVFG